MGRCTAFGDDVGGSQIENFSHLALTKMTTCQRKWQINKRRQQQQLILTLLRYYVWWKKTSAKENINKNRQKGENEIRTLKIYAKGFRGGDCTTDRKRHIPSPTFHRNFVNCKCTRIGDSSLFRHMFTNI